MGESFELSNPVTKAMALRVSRFKDDKQFSQLSSFNHFIVVLVLKGEGTVFADASEYDFKVGNFMSFSLYQPFKIISSGACEGYVVEFHPDFFCLHKHRSEVSCNGVLFNNIYESPLTNLPNAEVSELTAVMKGMLLEMQREGVDTEILLSYLKILLISASRIKADLRKAGEDLSNKMPDKIVALQNAIEANFRSMHHAAAYADLLNQSQGALNRTCKDCFNKTLSNLIADRIILEAKRELYLTIKPIKAIGYELGFTDEFHFSRYFKRNIGVSPQKFRETVGFGKAIAA